MKKKMDEHKEKLEKGRIIIFYFSGIILLTLGIWIFCLPTIGMIKILMGEALDYNRVLGLVIIFAFYGWIMNGITTIKMAGNIIDQTKKDVNKMNKEMNKR